MLISVFLLLGAGDTLRDWCEPTGYYQYIFGWQGPIESNGCTGAGPNLRGYMYWPIPSWWGSTAITSVSLRLVTNNSGSTNVNVNKVGAYPPTADDCADEPYTSSYPVPYNADVEVIIPLGGAIITDVKAAAGSQFGLGLSGTGADKFFYAHWSWEPYDAWLIINYESVGTDETPPANQGVRATLYDATGRQIADYGIVASDFRPSLSGLGKGIYFLRIGEGTVKIVK